MIDIKELESRLRGSPFHGWATWVSQCIPHMLRIKDFHYTMVSGDVCRLHIQCELLWTYKTQATDSIHTLKKFDDGKCRCITVFSKQSRDYFDVEIVLESKVQPTVINIETVLDLNVWSPSISEYYEVMSEPYAEIVYQPQIIPSSEEILSAIQKPSRMHGNWMAFGGPHLF
jgi:hypothetical protein